MNVSKKSEYYIFNITQISVQYLYIIFYQTIVYFYALVIVPLSFVFYQRVQLIGKHSPLMSAYNSIPQLLFLLLL